MPDSTVTYELNGKTFRFTVPKGSTEDFIHDTAQKYYDSRYPSVSTKQPPVNVQPVESQGFLGALGETLNPVNIAKDIVKPYTDLYHEGRQIAGLDPVPQATPLSDVPKEIAYGTPIIGSSLKDISEENYPAAAGHLTGNLALASLLSPEVRGGLRGGISSIRPTVENIKNTYPASTNLGKTLGAAAGYSAAHWPGLVIGRELGASLGPALTVAKHPIDLLSGIAKGAISGSTKVGQAGERIRTPSNSNISPSITADIDPVTPTNYSKSVRSLPVAPEGPIVNVQPKTEPGLPVAFSEIPRPARAPINVKHPDIIAPKVEPKVETQQVPPSTKSVAEDSLPSTKALDVAAPAVKPKVNKPFKLSGKSKAAYEKVKLNPAEEAAKKAEEPKASGFKPDKPIESPSQGRKPLTPPVKHPDEPNTVTTPKAETKPHFTHEIIGDIAKNISTPENKVTMTEVGRYIHENDLGTYEASKFGEGKFGAGRTTKTKPSEAKLQTKNAKDKIIAEGIKKYIKEHGEKF